MLSIIISVFIVLFIILVLFASIRIITQPNQGVVLTLGKFDGVLGSGLHFIKPFISHVILVNTAQTPVDLDQQVVITKDNAEISVKISLKYHVTNIEDFVFKNEDSVRSMIQDTRASLRGIIGNKELNEVLNGTQVINAALFKEISSVTAGYGLNVDRVNIDSVNPSADIQASMNRLLQATRERDATIATAEGKSKSITLENEANNRALLATNKAQNEALVNSAKAKATAVKTEADADAYRTQTLNTALSQSSENYFIFQNTEAVKALADGQANTVVLPNQTLDSLGLIPALTKLGTTAPKSN
ncbi:SPFH domain-containing protein [Lactiplantibacillus modestisalitolerans]|uniref:SPFH domain-containing protein n=1 Tax=Lactiplantibacillus modestisalitolerans TaxID=1457219 RepID=A0ABV5WTY8_9LACO|nr:SPFH domain-containing protein [Lactiplantibacillus modestisalitolerans]